MDAEAGVGGRVAGGAAQPQGGLHHHPHDSGQRPGIGFFSCLVSDLGGRQLQLSLFLLGLYLLHCDPRVGLPEPIWPGKFCSRLGRFACL